MYQLKIDGVLMPEPSLEGITESDEKIWSQNTKRISTGKMVGDIIAIKRTLSITWPVLTPDQVKTINSAVGGTTAFVPVTYTDASGEEVTKICYFGTSTKKIYSWADGIRYVTGYSVDAIEQ